MTDIAAILKYHIEQGGICIKDVVAWPCDAHQLGVALEAEATAHAITRGHLEDIRAQLHAAEAREQRLRAALDCAVAAQVRLTHHPVTNPMYPKPLCEWDGEAWPCLTELQVVEGLRAALATAEAPRITKRRAEPIIITSESLGLATEADHD